jgi:hypothetical protein
MDREIKFRVWTGERMDYDELSFALAFKWLYEMKPHMEPLKHTINGVELIQEFNLSQYGAYKVIGNIFQNKSLME